MNYKFQKKTAERALGLQEFSTGNNFGYCAFTTYGAFWISLGLLLIGNQTETYKSSSEDIGYFLLAFGLFTFIMWIGSAALNTALFLVFFLLLVGFILLTIKDFTGIAVLQKIAGVDLIVCALGAWYVMAHLIYSDVYHTDVLPVGPPVKDVIAAWWVKVKRLHRGSTV